MATASRRSSDSVGVAIPAYQHASFIAEAIESVLRQTRRPDQIVVVDDCSSDETYEVASSYSEVVALCNPKRLGPTATTGRAIDELRTDFVAVHDGDDRMKPRRLELQVAAMLADEGLRVVGGRVQPINSTGDLIDVPTGTPGSHLVEDWLSKGMLCGGSALLLRAPVISHDRRLTWASDWKFVIDNLAPDGRSEVLQEVVVEYRRHARSVTASHRAQGLSDHVRMSELLASELPDQKLRRLAQLRRDEARTRLAAELWRQHEYRGAAANLCQSVVESRGRVALSLGQRSFQRLSQSRAGAD